MSGTELALTQAKTPFTNATFTYPRSGPMCRDKCRPFCQFSLRCCPFLHPFTPYPLRCSDVHKLEGETSCQYTYLSMATERPALSCLWLADTLVLFRHWRGTESTPVTKALASQCQAELGGVFRRRPRKRKLAQSLICRTQVTIRRTGAI